MTSLTPEQRRQRREERRRRIRRRRIGALAFSTLALAGLFTGLTITGAFAGRDATRGGTSVAGTETTTTQSTSTAAQTTTTNKPKPKKKPRGRLGSGRPVTLAFGGDVHFEGIVRPKLDADPASVFAPIAPVLKSADLAMVNLETTVSYGGSPTPGKTYTFRALPTAFRALKDGGVDLATVANNHGIDYGMSSFLDTLRYAKRYHFRLVGGGLNAAQAYAPYRVTIKGQRIAILAASQVIDSNLIASWTAGPGKPGIASAYDVGRLTSAVRNARKNADTVVVYLHYGEERHSCPSSMQTRLARSLVAAGADIVVGSHAHRQQGAGRLGQAFVDYGLGNFVWYSQNSVPSVTTGVLKVTVTGRRIDRYWWVPATIVNGSPTPRTGSERTAAISAWRSLRGCTGLRP
ncbi:MAG: CapA family protein [Gaiellaceae bacterium]|jgi:poly-gamma-glutamate synthesis protein (capsule biosynthesis protein)